jgi:hypothetical protein
MTQPNARSPRNFSCPITEAPCTDPGCRRGWCIERDCESDRHARGANQDLIRRVRHQLPIPPEQMELARHLCPGDPFLADVEELAR